MLKIMGMKISYNSYAESFRLSKIVASLIYSAIHFISLILFTYFNSENPSFGRRRRKSPTSSAKLSKMKMTRKYKKMEQFKNAR